mgnify:CR=1 FL=1
MSKIRNIVVWTAKKDFKLNPPKGAKVSYANPRLWTGKVRPRYDAVYAPDYPHIEEAFRKAGRKIYRPDDNSGGDVDPEQVDGYKVLLPTEGAIQLTESEDRTIYSELVTGHENLIIRLQGELSHTIGVKGFSFDGTAGPTDAELADSANYTYQYTTVKNGPGVMLECD